MSAVLRAVLLAGLFVVLSGCSALVAVTGAAVTVVATGVKITAKTVGAVADAVIPDGDDEDEDDEDNEGSNEAAAGDPPQAPE